MKRFVFCALLLTASLSLTLAVHAETVSAAIAPQPLISALDEFVERTGLQVIYRSEIAASVRSKGADRGLTPQLTLEQLLRDTGLRYEFINERTVAIRAAQGASSAAAESEPPRASRTVAGGGGLQVAQAETTQTDTSVQSGESAAVEEVIVTGSHIRGSRPAGSKVVVIDREQIDKSGYGRVQDILGTLTQNFRGVSEDFTQQNVFNSIRGAEVQLRGLGAGTTLTLINGHRQAVGGVVGSFVDVSTIPTSAIERIEVLSDGASAIYGSDAIGGVVNIILRKDYSGFETGVRLSTASGDADETQLSQLFGAPWSSGNLLVGYQYYKRDALPSSSREYSASNRDLRRFGGGDFRTFNANPGTILCPAGRTDCIAGQPAYAIPAGQDGTSLTPGQLIPGGVNFTDTVTGNTVLPDQHMHSAFFNATQHFGETWELFTDGRYSRREMENSIPGQTRTLSVPASNPFYVNPFGGTASVRVAYDFTKDLGSRIQTGTTEQAAATLGAKASLPKQWQVIFSSSVSRENTDWRQYNGLVLAAIGPALSDPNPATALNVMGDGSHTSPATLAALRFNDFDIARSTLWSGGVLADGPLFDMPGGAARLAVGADYREERFRERRPDFVIPTIIQDMRAQRHISAAFAELALPLVGPDSAHVGLERLELSLAGRYERYSDFGNTFDPKVGLRWQPLHSVAVRGTWGTSFRAPPFYLLSPAFSAQSSGSTSLPDPLSSTGSSQVLYRSGNNPDLKEETATVWTAGLDLTLPAIPTLTAAFTYFDIDYKDRIANPSVGNLLTQQAQWAQVVNRNPTQAQIDAVCSRADFSGDCSGPFAAIVDIGTRNLAVEQSRGVDMDLRYVLNAKAGAWSFGLGGTYTLDLRTALTSTSPLIDVVDTVGNPLALKLRGDVSWSLREWNVGAFVNHSGSYKTGLPTPTTPAGDVGSFTTLDLNLGFRVAEGHGWLGRTQLSLSAVNVFDEQPPFVNQVVSQIGGYDGANGSLLGRQLSVQLVKSW